MHHDLGALGSAVNVHAIERQLRLIKEMGANALRTSHNPPAREVLDACGRLGLPVMDEPFDMWRTPKRPNGSSKYIDQWGETDLAGLLVGTNASPDLTFSTKYRFVWQVPYEAGSLGAVAFAGEKEVAVTEMRTAGPPAKLRVSADHTRLRADGEDVAFLTVRVEDREGNLCPYADDLVHFEIEGAGRVAGVDNGNAATVEPFQAKQRRAFGGLCLLIVRPNWGETGRIRVVSRAQGLQETEILPVTE